jgi:TonB dependent receptor
MIDAATLFSPNSGGFGTRLLKGVDQVNSGVEIAIEAKIAPQLTVSGATNLGYYRFSSRPTLSFTQDYREGTLDDVTVFQNNFLVPRTPQTLGAVSLRYEGRKFWFASISLNYADNMWFDFDPTLLTREFVGELVTQGLKPGDEIFDGIIAEEKAPANYTLDFFAGKSWRIKYKYFVNLNAGVNNILNNQNIITSGRYSYQSSFREVDDLRRYNNELIYAPGLNYFVSLTFRMN